MKLPSTWPVCVIDDQPEEYRKLFTVLNRLGVGFVHVAGDSKKSLPPSPFARLRLVFLDMHLGGDTLSSTTASQTANVFAHVVAPTTPPIVVVVWSKYASEVDAFRSELYRSKPEFIGKLIFILLEKPLAASKIQVTRLAAAMNRVLRPLLPLRLLWGWECLGQQAAVNTSGELFGLAVKRASVSVGDTAEGERSKLLTGLSEVLAAVMEAEAGKSASKKTASLDLLHAASAMLLDRLENSADLELLKGASSVLGTAQVPVSAAEQATMNAILVFGPPDVAGRKFKPGTLYQIMNTQRFAKKVGIAQNDFWRELCQKSVHQNEEKFAAWKRECKLIAIEVSATCDYAQQKRATTRILVGLLVPDSRKSDAAISGDSRKQDSRCTIARFNFLEKGASAATAVLPVFCSHFLFTPAWKRLPPYLKPIGRLREPALTDLRNWCFAQAARVGFLYSSEVKRVP